MPTALQEKFQAIEDDLRKILVEMDQEIHGSVLATITGTHIFFLGIPGVSKSYLVNHLLARIGGARTFALLMGNFTNPEDVFGPLDVAALKESHYRRLLDGYMADAHFSWLDEAWKANDSILNSLLEITNERTYKHDGKKIPVPLLTLFCASNELPSNDGLNAIYDRILQRYEVKAIQEPANFERMLQIEAELATVEPVVNLEDVFEAQAQVRAMPVSPAVYTALTEIRHELKAANIEPSDRRFKQAVILLQAEAWLEGFPSVEVDQVLILSNVLWDQPEQALDIDKILSEKANPRERETLELLNDIDKIGDLVNKALEDDDDDRKTATGMEVHPKVIAAFTAIKNIQNDSKITRRQTALVDRCEGQLKTHSYRLLKDVFGMSDEEINKMHREGTPTP
jgi:MoxR-like ATPase